MLTSMLNHTVKVRVTRAIGSYDKTKRIRFDLNFGRGLVYADQGTIQVDTYIMGITHPVKRFEGRVIAVLRRKNGSYAVVAAGKNTRFVNYQIEDAIAFAETPKYYLLTCLYENSCGAVVFRQEPEGVRFLLIRNCRSSHWGFPKGHMERGEDQIATAKREVLEETGLHIDVYDGFSCESNYKIGGRVDKNVRIFLGQTQDAKTVIQREEIDAYVWLPYEDAVEALNFENDKKILRRAQKFMAENLGLEA